MVFPRSQERGLIEAPLVAQSSWDPSLFPRSQERGLIEAVRICSEHVRHSMFPRSQERGLIEAFTIDFQSISIINVSAFARTRPH